MKALKRLAAAWTSLLFAACAINPEPMPFPDTGPTTLEVYEAHVSSAPMPGLDSPGADQIAMADSPLPALPAPAFRQDIRRRAEWARVAGNEINATFPQVQNPQLIGWVYYHLSEAGHPVPGYPTAFHLYDRSHYAKPGEVTP